MKKNALYVIVSFQLLCLLSSCGNHYSYIYKDNILFECDFAENKHIVQSENSPIDEFSIIYDNEDGTKSYYLFSAPIAYHASDGRLETADNSIIECTNKTVLQNGYKYQNKRNEVQIFFPNKLSHDKPIKIANNESFMQIVPQGISKAIPAKKTIITDIYNIKREAVVYSSIQENIDLVFYCNTLGLKCEIILKSKKADLSDFKFDIETSNLMVGTSNSEYITLYNLKDEPKAIFFNPCFKGSGKNDINISVEKSDYLTKSKGEIFTYTIKFDDIKSMTFPVTTNVSFYLYKTKQPDSSVKSKVSGNHYLSAYLFVGNNQDMGDMNTYVRFEANSFRMIDYTKIISAKYIVYDLSESNNSNIAAFRVIGNWGSPAITWREQPEIDLSTAYKPSINHNEYTFDITPLVIEWNKFLNGIGEDIYNNRFGFVMKNIENTQNEYNVFSAADNVTNCPRLIITYKP